jgi:SAM-dependent methyltransferase
MGCFTKEFMSDSDALSVWADIAERYVEIVDSAPHNALYERPALLDMIGDPTGLVALDVGCGSGFFASELLNRGAASVAAIDGTQAMVGATRARTKGQADVRRADLNNPLPFNEEVFDLVVASLVLHYVEAWPPLLKELRRILRAGGRVVMSTGHPMADFEESQSGNYFGLERFDEEWSSFGAIMPVYRRPLSMMIDQFAGAGFRLQELREPTPLREMTVQRPRTYEKLSKRPGFICLSFVANA